jgi:glycosyltransferase involved in cell wall biosynthesis
MKVLIAHPSFDVYGGAERLIVTLANHLESQGMWPTVLTASMSHKVREQLWNTRLIVTGSPDQNTMSAVAREIEQDFDVVNAHNAPAHLWCAPHRPRLVWTCNEPPYEYLKTGQLSPQEVRVTVRHVTRAVVADCFNYDRFHDIYGMQPDVVPYGVRGEWFSQGAEGSSDVRYYHRLKREYVLHVGYMTFTKNQVRTVECYHQALEQGLEADLVFVGPVSSYTSQVRQRAEELGLGDRVRVLGEISQDEVRDLYHQARCTVFPILAQGGWLSVFEAVAAGVPTMVSREFTACDIVQDHNLASVGQSDHDFAQFMLHPVPNPEGAAEYVVRNMTWDKYCQSMVDIFREVARE